MKLYIDNRSGTPIYDQIYSQIKLNIVNGEFCADEALPSIRSLAKELLISPITTKRAYEELEREGYIYTVAGKGCFIAPKSAERMRAESLHRLTALLAECRSLAAVCGLSGEELQKMLAEEEEEEH